MTENKDVLHKMQNDILKNAFDASIFPEEFSGSARDIAIIDDIGKRVHDKSIVWIHEAPSIFDNFLFMLIDIKKEDSIYILIKGYNYLQNELKKGSNNMLVKFKSFLETLFSYTSEYCKSIFSDPDLIMESLDGYKGIFNDLLSKSIYDYSLENGFPYNFITDVRSSISYEVYKSMLESFYYNLLNIIYDVLFLLSYILQYIISQIYK